MNPALGSRAKKHAKSVNVNVPECNRETSRTTACCYRGHSIERAVRLRLSAYGTSAAFCLASWTDWGVRASPGARFKLRPLGREVLAALMKWPVHEQETGECGRPMGTTFADLLGKLTVLRSRRAGCWKSAPKLSRPSSSLPTQTCWHVRDDSLAWHFAAVRRCPLWYPRWETGAGTE